MKSNNFAVEFYQLVSTDNDARLYETLGPLFTPTAQNEKFICDNNESLFWTIVNLCKINFTANRN